MDYLWFVELLNQLLNINQVNESILAFYMKLNMLFLQIKRPLPQPVPVSLGIATGQAKHV